MDFLLLLFLGWAITNLIVNSSILDGPRNYLLVKHKFIGELVSCVMCTGFWVGVLLYFVYFPVHLIVETTILFKNSVLDVFVLGFINSGFAVLVNSLIFFFIKKDN